MTSFTNIVKIVPSANVIHFPMPYDTASKSILVLTNQTNKIVCLKVKTTVPEMYQVQPTLTFLPPDMPTTVTITMFANSIQELAKSIVHVRHRFLFMVAFGPDSVDSKFDHVQFWRTLPTSQIYQQKLKCEFDEAGLVVNTRSPDRDETFPPPDRELVSRREASVASTQTPYPLFDQMEDDNSMAATIKRFVKNNIMFVIGILSLLFSLFYSRR